MRPRSVLKRSIRSSPWLPMTSRTSPARAPMTHNVTERSSPIPKIWMYRGSRAAAHRGGLHIVLQWAGLGIYDATHTKVNRYQWTDVARPKNFQKSTGGTSGAMIYDLPNPTAAKNSGGVLAQQAASLTR